MQFHSLETVYTYIHLDETGFLSLFNINPPHHQKNVHGDSIIENETLIGSSLTFKIQQINVEA
jgi:hypothetical protein